MYEQELENLGLSGKEAKVYVTALGLGPETVQNIAKESGINRATTYVQINALKDKGLMSEFDKGKKTYFVAESPNRLKNLLAVFEKELALKKQGIDSMLPGLVSMFEGMGERPKVRFFEGIEGARAMNQDFLSTKDKTIQGFLNLDHLFRAFPEYEQQFTDYRIKKKITSHLLYTQKSGPRTDATDKRRLRVGKFIPFDKLPLNAAITLYDDKVAIVTYKNSTVGVIIDSKDVTDTLRAIFYYIWNSVK